MNRCPLANWQNKFLMMDVRKNRNNYARLAKSSFLLQAMQNKKCVSSKIGKGQPSNEKLLKTGFKPENVLIHSLKQKK